MSETQIIQQSETLALIAALHGREAIETIARIMKTSDSDPSSAAHPARITCTSVYRVEPRLANGCRMSKR